jgi:hypothetical protein
MSASSLADRAFTAALLDEDTPALTVITPEMCEDNYDPDDEDEEDGEKSPKPAKIPLPESFGKLVPEQA